jgi:ATP-dependent DNA helicase RecG
MLSDQELERLFQDHESDRVERKESLSNRDRICQAICAYANDLPQHRAPGVVFVGVRDDGTCAGLAITDQLLQTLAHMRSDGNILPFPVMTVHRKTLSGCDAAVILVEPSDAPPVRYDGRVWIRVGPRRAIATVEEERRLNEKRRSRDLPYDLHELNSVLLDDLDLDLFRREYLASALPADVIAANRRSTEDQLASLRFTSSTAPYHPTVTGMLVLGKSPADFIPGAYLQFSRFEGVELADPVRDAKEIHGPLSSLLRLIDEIFQANIAVAVDLTSGSRELRAPEYPLTALQQVVRNAVLHRDYQTSHAPVRINWFSDRIEIQNPGGPFGQVTCDNFGSPGITDYRNPHLAEAMKALGFVQRFGVGIATARRALEQNTNPPLEFTVQPNHVLATIRRRK